MEGSKSHQTTRGKKRDKEGEKKKSIQKSWQKSIFASLPAYTKQTTLLQKERPFQAKAEAAAGDCFPINHLLLLRSLLTIKLVEGASWD